MSSSEKVESNLSSENENESPIKAAVLNELARINSQGPWLWKLFFLCSIPSILNGFHVSSYIFLGPLPNQYWCTSPDLLNTTWTQDQKKEISTKTNISCEIKNWNYKELSNMNYEEALNFTRYSEQPEEISCSSVNGRVYNYEQEPGISIVPEWELVCENNFWRTTVQVALSIGKFSGAFIFGILSDKYGRRTCFIIASLLYIISGFLTTFSPWYTVFVLGRIGLGASGTGVFYATYTLLSENVDAKIRSKLCLLHSLAYPIGMVILAALASSISQWRHLQLAISVPAVLLLIICYFLFESPRWLLLKGREEEAYKIVFRKEADKELLLLNDLSKPVDKEDEKTIDCQAKIKNSFNELIKLYGNSKIRKMALICHFTWCVTSMSYYVTALNADNFAANRYWYVAITGMVDAPGYLASIVLLKYLGRKTTSCSLFMLAGFSLLICLAIPKENTSFLIFFAMFGRFGISAVYAVLTLHTSEMFPTEIRNSAIGTSGTFAHMGSIAAPYIVDLLGFIAWFIPTTICGVAITLAAVLTLLQPETRGKELSDHVSDDEKETKR